MNQKLLKRLKPERVEVEIIRVEESEETEIEESELDDIWSYVDKESNPRWRATANDCWNGEVLAICLVVEKTKCFLNLKSYLSHLELSITALMVGEPMNDIYQRSTTK